MKTDIRLQNKCIDVILGFRSIPLKKKRLFIKAKRWTRAGEHPLDCKSQEQNNTSLTLDLCELVTVSSC